MSAIRLLGTVAGVAAAFILLVLLGVRHYDGNVSALLHMDVPFGERHRVPEGIVLYEDAAYDGMLYYQVARDIPELFTGRTIALDSPYRFQRILLPLFMNAVTLGDERGFAWALLLINLSAVLGALALMLRLLKRASIHALTAVVNPAATVGVLYSLTEPLSLLFVVAFLGVWERAGRRVTAWGVLALSLSLFARETTVFLIALLFMWSLWKRRWRDAALSLAPMLPFVAWQRFLDVRFGAVGFQANGNVVGWPFSGPIDLLHSLALGVTSYRLSAAALLAFVLPLCVVLARDWWKEKIRVDVMTFLTTGLCGAMLVMDSHMWGAITSIGRVVTPMYPVYALYAAEKNTPALRWISAALIAVTVVASIGIAAVPHPFRIS